MTDSHAPTRVLHVAPGLGSGGVGRLIEQWCAATDEGDFEYEIATLGPGGIFDDILRGNGCQIHEIRPLRDLGVFRYMRQFDILLRKGRYDIVHSHMGLASIFVFVPAILHGVPARFLHAHANRYSNDPGHGLRGRALWLLRMLNCFMATDRVACSHEAARYVFPSAPFVSWNAQVVLNGIDLERFQFRASLRESVREERGVSNGLVVGTVGRLSAEKNQAHLVAAFAHLLRKRHDSWLWLVGEGPDRPRLEELCVDLGVAQRVMFIPATVDIPRELAGMDVFVLPSKSEGLGIAAIEAQSMGLPCLVSDGVPHEVDVTGLVEFLSLDAGLDFWANQMLNRTPQDRHIAPELLARKGYDAKASSTLLRALYRCSLALRDRRTR